MLPLFIDVPNGTTFQLKAPVLAPCRCIDCDAGKGLTAAGRCTACMVGGAWGRFCDSCSGRRPSQCLQCRDVERKGRAFFVTASGQCQQVSCTLCSVQPAASRHIVSAGLTSKPLGSQAARSMCCTAALH